MIDKITPRPHEKVQALLAEDGFEDNNTITLTRTTGGGDMGTYVVSISTDEGENWTEIAIPFVQETTEIATIDSGEKVMFKYVSGSITRDLNSDLIIGSNGTFNAYGNAMSLSYTDFVQRTGYLSLHRLFKGSKIVSAANLILPATTLSKRCYTELFNGCTSLTAAPELPATTLAKECYSNMFKGCTSLTTAPELPATTTAEYCYNSMFEGCTSLTTVPSVLPATTLANYCYAEMFSGCTALTTAPTISATTVGTYSCESMFEGCTSLTTVPSELLATSLAENCYHKMFSKCTALASTPAFTANTVASGCCWEMFGDCTSLTAVSSSLLATTLANDCYRSMFCRCTSLTTAPELPATTLAANCYRYMFLGSTALTSAPSELPATTLAEYCYNSMFSGCTSLTAAPSELPATTLVDSCYKEMFRNCTSLIAAPEICATTVANECCRWMFSGCASLTAAPSVLPATTLADGCYYSMFGDCTSLTTAPELPATTLVYRCYWHMFDNSKVSYVKCLATDISATECTKEWLYRVPNNSGCTFVKASTMEDWTRDKNGIPDKWTVYNETHVEVTGVTINASAATVNKGSTYTLTASVLPLNADDQVVLWSTSNPNVATVSDGVVTGVGCGNATITVTTHEKGYTATCDMSVENHVTAVDLNTYVATINTGGTYQLIETITPSDACNKSVTWSSNNPSVATVDSNGLVSGVTTGSATVTVTTTDGGLTKNCGITVNEGQHATAVTLSDASISLEVNSAYTLTATVLPADAVNKNVTWSSSNNNVATVDSSGEVTGVATGSAIITVTTVDGGLTAQCSVSVSAASTPNFFTIESLVDNNGIGINRTGKSPGNRNLSYSLDGGQTWTDLTLSANTSFSTINTGDKIMFKGVNDNLATAWDKYWAFSSTKNIKVYGNVMSLLWGDDFESHSEFKTGKNHNLCSIFRGTTTLIDASDLILPASACTENCYNGMFRGCTNLTAAPELPATVSASGCCSSMFEGCINLEEAPEINFTSLTYQCCMRMFNMSRSSKITTPKMTKSPVLSCTTGAEDCYREMFSGNGNLVEVTCLLNDSINSTANWMTNVSSTGTFYKNSLKTWSEGTSACPSGWTQVDYTG
jgi:uncharacterized protein YjdB